MKTIIAGSRSITDRNLVFKLIEEAGFEITEVVSGAAYGVDKLGEWWAKSKKIPIKSMPADWSIGKSAGYRRNEAMAEYAEAAIIIHDGISKGSSHMRDIAYRKGLKVFYKNLGEKDETFIDVDDNYIEF